MALVGIDLGGSKTAVGVVEDGEVRDRAVLESRGDEGPEHWADRVSTAVAALAGGDGAGITAVGVGVAGQIDEAGRLTLAPNLGWARVDVGALVTRRTALPTAVLGDVQAIAMGEWLYGVARGERDVAAVFLGTGVGAGLVIDGELRRGAGGSLGEVGHLVVSLDGPSCTCGGEGCLETYVGGWAIEARARERLLAGEASSLSPDATDAARVAEAARSGDAVASAVLDQAARALGAGLASILHSYNPGVVVFGGGVAMGIPELVDRAVEHTRQRALTAPLRDVEFVTGSLGVDAGILGAAGWAGRRVERPAAD